MDASELSDSASVINIGVAGLADLLGGGTEQDASTLVPGALGTGKSTPIGSPQPVVSP